MPAIDSHTLTQYLNETLKIDQFTDYAPNGLQVQGKPQIERIVTGVTACQALIEKAILLKADAILVHHGFFWKNEPPCITDMKYNRIKALLDHNIALYAYHLPLDAHDTLGNNVQLAKVLEIDITGELNTPGGINLGLVGKLATPMNGQALGSHLSEKLKHTPIHIEAARDTIETVAWCTGAAHTFIDAAINAGVDAYISGEISEPIVHTARERNIHYFSAGHHATERFGVQALGKHLQETFDLNVQYVDIYSPV